MKLEYNLIVNNNFYKVLQKYKIQNVKITKRIIIIIRIKVNHNHLHHHHHHIEEDQKDNHPHNWINRCQFL
jgi:hypothetical protein